MGNNKRSIFDINDNPLNEGDSIRFLNTSEDLLSGLSQSDQSAIQDQINKIMTIQNFNEYGHIELEFTDSEGNMHFMWVESKDVEKI